jgi:hypothetical protein
VKEFAEVGRVFAEVHEGTVEGEVRFVCEGQRDPVESSCMSERGRDRATLCSMGILFNTRPGARGGPMKDFTWRTDENHSP